MGRTDVRRRRMVAAAMAVVAAVVLSAPVAGALGRDPQDAQPADRTYVVRPGDTVWSIAGRFAAGADPRILVDAIASRNGIDPGSIVPGQALVIPAAA